MNFRCTTGSNVDRRAGRCGAVWLTKMSIRQCARVAAGTLVGTRRAASAESISSPDNGALVSSPPVTVIRRDNARDGGNLQRKGACNSLPEVQVTRLRVI